jgi:hypothetical protein
MSSRLSDPQRLVELVADQMFREEMRSRNGYRPATESGAGPAWDRHAMDGSEATGEQRSPCDPPD